MQKELNIFLETLGKQISKARKRMNMSQTELAEKADLSLTYVSKIECGHKNISVYTLAKISEALKLSSSEIIADAGKDEIVIIEEAVKKVLSRLSPQKRGDVLQILNILIRIIAH